MCVFVSSSAKKKPKKPVDLLQKPTDYNRSVSGILVLYILYLCNSSWAFTQQRTLSSKILKLPEQIVLKRNVARKEPQEILMKNWVEILLKGSWTYVWMPSSSNCENHSWCHYCISCIQQSVLTSIMVQQGSRDSSGSWEFLRSVWNFQRVGNSLKS